MANYINYISDDELTDWVLDYLKAVDGKYFKGE